MAATVIFYPPPKGKVENNNDCTWVLLGKRCIGIVIWRDEFVSSIEELLVTDKKQRPEVGFAFESLLLEANGTQD